MDYRGARFYDVDVARFLSLDPLAAQYPSLSDYAYVAGNPVMFVDPDGKEVRVYYKEGDQDRYAVYKRNEDGNYSYYDESGNIMSEEDYGNNDFLVRTKESFEYLMNSERAAQIIDELTCDDDFIVKVASADYYYNWGNNKFYEEGLGETKFHYQDKILFYNPYSALKGENKDGTTFHQNPSISFLHELSHALGLKEIGFAAYKAGVEKRHTIKRISIDPKTGKNVVVNALDPKGYTNDEEERVITGDEELVIEQLRKKFNDGLDKRDGHHGNAIPSRGPTTIKQ